MIKALIFDNGGVLVKDTWLYYLDKESRKLGIKKETFTKMLSPLVSKAVVGEMSFFDFLKEVSKKTGDSDSANKILKPHNLNQNMVKLILKLKKNYQIALLSNDLGSFKNDNKLWKMEKVFGKNIFHSSEMKVAKPNPGAFIYALKALDVRPSDILFIDDKVRNTSVAESLGLKSIVFKNISQLKKEFKKLGLFYD